MEDNKIYEDIAMRTAGDIYLGVVGPVRTGKSTFIKRFMEALVIPNIENVYMKERAKDELPQSGSGRTIMTAEPKFVPEDAVQIAIDGGTTLSVRLIDCVGYMVNSAVGQFEGENERMVTTPWFDHEVPMREAAETGTQKVIAEHSTIGIVVTTDGTITDIDRSDYIEPERRVITELQEIGKPFIVILNSAEPLSGRAAEVKNWIEQEYNVICIVKNCLELETGDITEIMKSILYEFPIQELGIHLPSWVEALEFDNPIKTELFQAIKACAGGLSRIKDVREYLALLGEQENICRSEVRSIELGSGSISAEVELPRQLLYVTLSEQTGFAIADDGDLIPLLTKLSNIQSDYDKIQEALQDVRTKGYGVVLPGNDELTLQEPEIVKQGGRYGVRLKASAPSIHMIMANVETEVSPGVGGEKSSEDIINYLLQEFEGDVSKIWDSNIFGKSLYEIAGEGLNAKIKKMPEDAQGKLQETLQRIINEGSNGLICIIL